MHKSFLLIFSVTATLLINNDLRRGRQAFVLVLLVCLSVCSVSVTLKIADQFTKICRGNTDKNLTDSGGELDLLYRKTLNYKKFETVAHYVL